MKDYLKLDFRKQLVTLTNKKTVLSARVKKHNKNIERNDLCPICKKMKSGFEMIFVDKG
jgi:hypothetical protein